MRRSLGFAAAVLATKSHAQDLSQTIVGCVDVGCPAATDNVNDNCTIVSSSFSSVGLTRIPDTSDALQGVSWVKGFNITDADGARSFHESFYFGAPADLDLADTGACAVFFNGVAETLSFNSSNPNQETAQGTCQDAMGSSCVDALVRRATGLSGLDGFSSADACTALAEDLRDNMDSECEGLAVGWTNLTAVALTGNGAPEPISGSQNSTSTCWPITPKSDSVTLVTEYTRDGDLQVSTATKAQWAITPVLTLFFQSNGTLITDTEASLSCLKVMGPANASLDTQSGSDDNKEGAAMTLGAPGWTISSVGMAAIFLLFSL
ncbi:uncharacterized protein BCR38DRAFT_478618 [Pseudomassariella vexata]|uniref:Uncharacterized protein n=1 Tax=Pseudomassariella vexata TaxID=1141098 RepID=A0A1Y2DCL7_9PEZI|nr:uncharacterized protein BCR38DRAFT_478618 [Pseudomassariella vexata]ORY56998.1 hypothetical protein BCR38DRAFT_478618 [Pseudomassariella vexata]